MIIKKAVLRILKTAFFIGFKETYLCVISPEPLTFVSFVLGFPE